jgi:hypothetical protein
MVRAVADRTFLPVKGLFEQVGNMVAMPVRKQDIIGLQAVYIDILRQLVVRNERIE